MTTPSLPCGHCEETISGETEDDLVARVQSHVREHARDLGFDHPVTREQVLGCLRQGHQGPGRPGTRWEDRYTSTPPWDIGRPQPAFRALAEQGALRGRVLDAGCGTGEHALLAAGLGLDATGIDIVPRALEAAGAKARERGLTARFLRHDARTLASLGESFDTVLDCGLFHIFTGVDRTAYAGNLHAVMTPGGRYFMLGFSDRQPEDQFARHRMTLGEITAAFADGWRVDSIEPATIDSNVHPGGVRAWLLAATRL